MKQTQTQPQRVKRLKYQGALIVTLIQSVSPEAMPIEDISQCWFFLQNPIRFKKVFSPDILAWAESYDKVSKDDQLIDILFALTKTDIICDISESDDNVLLKVKNDTTQDLLTEAELEEVKADAKFALRYLKAVHYFLEKTEKKDNIV